MNLNFGNRTSLATLAMLATMGSAPGGPVERLAEIGRRSLARKARRGRRRLSIATGPGSISAKAEVDQLCWAGDFEGARELSVKHFEACGEKLDGPAGFRCWPEMA